jgi:hypothetical protein
MRSRQLVAEIINYYFFVILLCKKLFTKKTLGIRLLGEEFKTEKSERNLFEERFLSHSLPKTFKRVFSKDTEKWRNLVFKEL